MLRVVGTVVLAALLLSGCNDDKAKDVADPNAKVTVIEVVKEGKGQTLKKDDYAWVLYRGTFTDTTDPKNPKEVQFDTNMDDLENQVPFRVWVGNGGMIKGFDDTVAEMEVGERRKVLIPWELGYGAAGNGTSIPPMMDLTFEIEVVYGFRESEKDVFDIEKDEEGTGTAAKAGDTVEIHYKGTYLTGKVWDDTEKRGSTAKFKLGDREKVIPGINAGMGGLAGSGVDPMRVGGKRTIVIPHTLAFGPAGSDNVQGLQPLRIEIELMSVNGKK